EKPIIAKFGGTSLKDADQVKKVIDIVKSNTRRRHIVVSAPDGITDLLYILNEGGNIDYSAETIINIISQTYSKIIGGLGIEFDLAPHIDFIKKVAWKKQEVELLASRGEYIMAKILAKALGFEFIDAARIICFNPDKTVNMEATWKRRNVLLEQTGGCVIPGFYGALPSGRIMTFSRGGTDVTGAVVSWQASAEVYEKYTDVSGLHMAHPEIVKNPNIIGVVTYKELRELSYMGANVVHEDALFPLRTKKIPMRIRKLDEPDSDGTLIVPDNDTRAIRRTPGSLVGIAGRKDFTVITLEKTRMNQQVGFLRRVCAIFEKLGINIEHIPGGIDAVSIIADTKALDKNIQRSHFARFLTDKIALPLFRLCNKKAHKWLLPFPERKINLIRRKILQDLKPGSIMVKPGMALISTVGHDMTHMPGVALKILGAIESARINVRMVNQGSSARSIIVGVENKDLERAIRAIYKAFVDEQNRA
ncbi:aspartate kinase, partial [bacterium]|nr:aspartate kinase [bacterium]